jgi:hypothetical protein
MAKINGTIFRVRVEGTVVGSTKTVDFTLEQDDPKTTTDDSAGWEESLAAGGIRRASGSFSGLFDTADTYNGEELFDVIINNSGLLTLEFGFVGGIYYTCEGKLLNVKMSKSTEEAVTLDGSFVSSGAVSKGVSMAS